MTTERCARHMLDRIERNRAWRQRVIRSPEAKPRDLRPRPASDEDPGAVASPGSFNCKFRWRNSRRSGDACLTAGAYHGPMRLTFAILLCASLFTWDATINRGRYTGPFLDFLYYRLR